MLPLRNGKSLVNQYHLLTTIDGDGVSDRDARTHRLYPDQPSLLLEQKADFYLDLFKKHPDRPWYLWRWWLRYPGQLNFRALDRSGLVLSQQPAEAQRQASEFADGVRILRELDPENGYPLYFQAWLEAKEGVALVQEDGNQPFVPTVINPESAAKAAEFLHDAVAQKHFSYFEREAGAEWMAVIGRPRTYVEALMALEQLGGLPIPNLAMARDMA